MMLPLNKKPALPAISVGGSRNKFAAVPGVPKALHDAGRYLLAVIADGQIFRPSRYDRFLLLVRHWP